jgi:hypothetical protein
VLLLPGWTSSDIVWMESKDSSNGKSIQISQDAQGNWTLGPGGKQKVEAGVGEELRTQIVEIRTMATLPLGLQMDAVGLSAPTRFLSIRNKQGKQSEIHIGKADPTGSGYYVQVDNQSPVVVDKYTFDGTLNLFNNALATPTPLPQTPAPTSATPNAPTTVPTATP